MTVTGHARLNALGLLCPLPVIRTQDTVKGLGPGTELEVLATDPGARPDIQAWCRVHGHEYLGDSACEAGRCPEADRWPEVGRAHFHIRLRVSD